MRVVVGVADMAVSNNTAVNLATYSLGSCLGITVYDPVVRAGGMLHIMLPTSELDPVKAQARPAMFVDTGLQLLMRETAKLRVQKERMIICVAGGAQFLEKRPLSGLVFATGGGSVRKAPASSTVAASPGISATSANAVGCIAASPR